MTSLLPNIWAVRVPKDAQCVELNIDVSEDWYILEYILVNDDEESGFYGEDVSYDIELPPGNWSLIGVGISEEVAGKILEEYGGNHEDQIFYPDFNNEYKVPDRTCTARDSLISLLKSNGLNMEDNYVFIKSND